MEIVSGQVDESYAEKVIKEANIKMLGVYNKRLYNDKKEVRMEARVESLEKAMTKVDVEMQMMNKTMRDIAETLKDIKDDQKKIQSFEIQKAMLERDINDQKKLIEFSFQKIDSIKNDVQALKESNAGSAVKINNSERVIWFIISGAIGALGIFTR